MSNLDTEEANVKNPKNIRSYFADGMLIIGCVILSIGIGMIYIPAGVISVGLLFVVCGVLDGLSGGDL